MSFRDWDDEDYSDFHDAAFEEIFNNIEGIQDLSLGELQEAEALFEAGWLTWDGSYDMDQIYAIRDEFYDLVGMYEEDFDWEEFRELYDSVLFATLSRRSSYECDGGRR